MMTTGQHIVAERLIDLERTVDVLNERLREVQRELHHAKGGSLAFRLWQSVSIPGSSQGFMSKVCDRRIRPNTRW